VDVSRWNSRHSLESTRALKERFARATARRARWIKRLHARFHRGRARTPMAARVARGATHAGTRSISTRIRVGFCRFRNASRYQLRHSVRHRCALSAPSISPSTRRG
jgi:hypothetical protein